VHQLVFRNSGNLRALKDVGIVAGVGIVAPSAMIVGAIGTSGGLLGEGGYGVPLQILAQTQVTKSALFPITPAPTRLVLNYSASGEARELSLELPELAGLHLKARPSKAPRPLSASIQAAP
jgi:hypothetical protein